MRGIEPRSEMVYRSSIYMLSYRIRFRLQRRSVTHNCRLFRMDFTRHLTEDSAPRYPVIVGALNGTDRQEAVRTAKLRYAAKL